MSNIMIEKNSPIFLCSLFFIAALFVISFSGCNNGVASPGGKPSVSIESFRSSINALSGDPDLSAAQIGVYVFEIETKKVIAELGATKTLLPASTQKTITSAAALGILGEDFRFETEIQYDGELDEAGVLHGNVYIKGKGDPTIGSDRFGEEYSLLGIKKAWVSALKSVGIKKIKGAIIGDAQCFEDALIPTTWVWSDMGNYYGAGACGLTLHESYYELFFKPAANVGDTAKVLRTEPEIREINWVNEMKTGSVGSGDQGYIYGAPYTYLRYLRGSIPQGNSEFSIKGSIPDPALFTAQWFSRQLEEEGIQVEKPATTFRLQKLAGKKTLNSTRVIYTHQSPKLREIVYWLNKRSINLYAEHLLKYIGYHQTGKGSTEAGLKVVREFWESKGISMEGCRMMDGSGLSRYNGVTAQQLAEMLAFNRSQKYFNSFFASLPVAGLASDPGSLKYLCKGTSAANNLRAKSGYIMSVWTYTGYVKTKSGKNVCFALLANNYSCSNAAMRKKWENIMVEMAELE